MSEHITLWFNGQPIAARAGESVAAALTAAGLRTLRTTRSGQPRGLFCGMGVCQECLVEIDGRPNQRACMVRIDRPMQVLAQAEPRPLPPAAAPAAPAIAPPLRLERPEILVIGGGPGGLSAAIAAREAGAEVALLDERGQPGGQYYKQLAIPGAAGDAQHRAGARLIAHAAAAGVDLRGGALVWGAFAPREFVATDAGRTVRFEPRCAIVATGAYERGWPVPGWTLPGVMTTGAAQTLWRTARRLPGQRVLIAGNGPLNLQLAAELLNGGAEVVAVVEAAPKPGPGALPDLLAMAAAAPLLVRDGLHYRTALLRHGVRMLHASCVAGVSAEGAALRVTLAGAAAGHSFTVDTVCLGYGFEPSNELLRALGCAHDFDPSRGHLVTRRDAAGRTDVAGVLALGDCTGLGGAQAALAEGTLAGLAAAADCGHPPGPRQRALQQESARALARHRRFQRALWQVFAAPGFAAGPAAPNATICRCEEVTFAQVDAALAEGHAGSGAVKRRTRLGMGRCQGRYCAPVLEAILAARTGRAPDAHSGFAPRPPVRPVAIADLLRP
jgi:thioredoxin reductase